MRTIKGLAVPQNDHVKFPFSTILNETDLNDGTPVVEEIYGDVLTNIYKLLQSVGITPTESQDSDITQYQILDALKKLPNSLNDVERILSLSANTWSTDLNIDFLPNKYFFIARASDNYSVGASYFFKGTTGTTYDFVSSGFSASDELLVIIDSSTVRAYSITNLLGAASNEVFTNLSTPISFNDSDKLWYQSNGKLLSDTPSVDDLESIIRIELSDGTVIVNDIFVLNGKALCFCFIPGGNDYFFRQFDLGDLSVSEEVTVLGLAFGTTSDLLTYAFAEQGNIYVTNGANNSVNDYSISKFVYDSGSATLTFASTTSFDVSFVKTTNTAIKGGLLYTFIGGELVKYNTNTGERTSLGVFPIVLGQLFGFNGFVYYCTGEVSKKWF